MKEITPMRAIRAKCIDCCGGNIYEPRHCTAEGCPLHPYRTGHKPKKTNSMAEGGPEPECGATHAENGTNKEAK